MISSSLLRVSVPFPAAFNPWMRANLSPSSSTTLTPTTRSEISFALARQMTAPTGGRIITLFGCGGDRDRTKRPKMGQAAGEGSDFVVATSDNPRSEDPLAILAEVEPALKATGVSATPSSLIAPRPSNLRSQAAQPHDVVLIAGKGHEKEQILATGSIPFRRLSRLRFPRSPNWVTVECDEAHPRRSGHRCRRGA